MKDFLSYVNDEENKTSSSDFKSTSSNPFDLFANLSKAYEGKSAEEVFAQIIKEAEKGRKNGTLTDQDIDNFVSKVSPLLSDKQRKMLSKVVEKLKSIN